ncbi:ArsR/SmtB family transcription factor [Methanobrevibacter olleyae]|uniref:ArsR family transcriptional regulator n=1 Tax=Methanobrevibacter olleyae TaxID=294671 RepID=A0A126QYZ0_METOL|nr:metalloregulator ArsR/SmtB family transcription factor [Methanobrevibacter olleyae]AMK15373.1 ArsR family transcriptional regulator [Methanobrevibacter olleyae]SFL49302.1 transcriptional regulator, ArsR family [Methanobrevibacter olleyae]
MQEENSNNNLNDDVCEVFHPHEDSIERAKKHTLAEEEYADLSEFFKIFGNPTRLKIISLLSFEDLCVCDICESLGLNQTAVSNQLRILRVHNIVKYEKEGKLARYSLTDLHVEMIYKMGLEHINE